MDLVIFAGPVIVTDAHKKIDWLGRDVRIVPVVFSGNSNGKALAESLRDSSGRILPSLLAKYAPELVPDQIALASFSAGYGLLDPILAVDADRALVTATCFADSVFLAGDPKTGAGGPVHPGAVAFGAEAVDGDKLLVSTSAHTTDGTYLTGMQSWTLTWQAIAQASGAGAPKEVSPKAPVPVPPDGFFQLGSECFWGDYGDMFTHEQHNDLSAAVWQAYLAPWLAGSRGFPAALVGALFGGAAALAVTAALSRR